MLSALAEGKHQVILEAFDEVMNIRNSSNLTIYVDVTDPLGSGNWTNATFVFTTQPYDSIPPTISNVFAGNPGARRGRISLPE